jgi:hypothetical protein
MTVVDSISEGGLGYRRNVDLLLFRFVWSGGFDTCDDKRIFGAVWREKNDDNNVLNKAD